MSGAGVPRNQAASDRLQVIKRICSLIAHIDLAAEGEELKITLHETLAAFMKPQAGEAALQRG
jgi:hypothetical protein